ncbi:TetR/AcrR family transcriptional regulator [Candidatus Cloacimonadota bacterium]
MQVKKDEIREQIKVVAKTHFLEKGFQNTSMRAIAKEVKISAGNIYTYFQSKEDIFLQLLTEDQVIRLNYLAAKIKSGENSWDKIKIYAEEYFHYVERQPDTLKFGVYWEFHGLDESKISQETIKMRSKVYTQFDLWEIFQQGKKDGSIKAGIDKDIYISFTMILRLLMNEILVLKYRDNDFYFKYLEFFLDAIKSK